MFTVAVEPSPRIELGTPSLPRKCTATVLRGRTGFWFFVGAGVASRFEPRHGQLGRLSSSYQFWERAMGFEPTTSSLEGWNSTAELHPLLLSGLLLRERASVDSNHHPRAVRGSLVEGEGFEPSKAWSRQIYSLLPLAARASLHEIRCCPLGLAGAGGGTRTRDLLITSQVLYRLSYASLGSGDLGGSFPVVKLPPLYIDGSFA
jgi:hypothetical protein